MSEQERFPVGTRVRHRRVPSVEGVVMDQPASHQGYRRGSPEDRYVHWDDGAYLWENVVVLERADTPEPPRAPVRTLAPGIESRPDVQGGKPCLAGTRTPTDVVRGWRDWADFAPHFPHVTEPEYERAVLVEAGVTAERERRRRRKEKRAVKRYRKVVALAEAKEDDRG